MSGSSWYVWSVRVWGGRMSICRKGVFASQASALRHALRLGRGETRPGIRYYVRPVGRVVSRDPRDYRWVNGGQRAERRSA